MGMNGHELDATAVEELLGAYALDACEPDEVAAIERHLAENPTLAREAERLRNAAVWIGAADALEAPPALRTSVLEVARSRRPAAGADPVLDLYVGQSEALGEVIDDLDDDDLDRVTTNGLSVRDLVIHCAAQESLAAQLAGRPTVPDVTETDIDAAQRDAHRAVPRSSAGGGPRAVGRGRSRRSARGPPTPRTSTGPSRGSVATFPAPTSSRSGPSRPGSTPTTCAARGRRTETPPPGHLAVMSNLAGRVTGFGLVMVGRSRPGKTARLVLTGAGGGDWLIAMGGGTPGASPDVTVTADVVDWCRLVGERIAPDELDCGVVGDTALADDLLVAASAFATL